MALLFHLSTRTPWSFSISSRSIAISRRTHQDMTATSYAALNVSVLCSASDKDMLIQELQERLGNAMSRVSRRPLMHYIQCASYDRPALELYPITRMGVALRRRRLSRTGRDRACITFLQNLACARPYRRVQPQLAFRRLSSSDPRPPS